MHNASNEFLLREFVGRKARNERYSERAFARTLGLSPGFLKLVFQGKRSLSLDKAREVADRLGWTGLEAEAFLASLQKEKDGPRSAGATVKQFGEISDWFHFAIVELLKIKNKKWGAAEIAKRLGISRAEADYALQLLREHGLIQAKAGEYRSVATQYVVPAFSSSGIRKFHRQMLEKAIAAIEEQKVEERRLRSLTLAVDSARMDEAAQMIKDFMQRFERRFTTGKPDRVYQLTLAFFGLDKGGDK